MNSIELRFKPIKGKEDDLGIRVSRASRFQILASCYLVSGWVGSSISFDSKDS